MNNKSRLISKVRGYRLRLAGIAALAIIVSFSVLAGCSNSKDNTLTLASKGFTEQNILVEIYKQLIEHDTDFKVKIKTGLDGDVLWKSITSKNVDAYVEYTGTGLLYILKHDAEYDAQKVYDIDKEQFNKKFDITWLDPIGFNNTYSFALRKERADELGLKTTSDLAAKSKQLVFGTAQEYLKRDDGYPLVQKVYNTDFKDIKSIENHALDYQALQQKLVDVVMLYTTDGKIPSSNLTLLEDDKNVFLPYYAAPIVRNDVLKKHPELKKELNKLAGQITTEDMQKLNERVDVKHEKEVKVAREWLKEHDYLK